MSKYPGRVITDLAPAGYSVYFDGTGDYLNSSVTAIGTSNFTVEYWSYLTAHGGTNGEGGYFQISGTAGGLSSTYTVGVLATRSAPGAGSVLNVIVGGTTISTTHVLGLNTWFHTAIVRNSNSVSVYVNGTLVSTPTTLSTNLTGTFLAIGGYFSTAYLCNGYISNFRVTNSALYTAAFTPPTQLLNITNTSLLTCNSPAIIDQSSNAFALTVNGNAAVSTLTPFTAYVPYNPALGASTPGVWTVDEAMQAAATRQWNMYDPYFNLTTLLLHGNGTNGAQNNTFLDSSTNNFTITRNGNTTQGSYSPFSQTGWSTFFDGSGDSFSVSTSTVLDLNGAIDFTIEAWVYLTGYGSTSDMSLNIANKFTGAGGLGYTYGIFGGGANQGKIQFYGAAGSVSIISTNVIPLNSWNHVAIVKSGTTYTHYLNGVANGSQTTASTLTASANALVIGDYGYSDDFLGYMSNLRITKNGAVYTSGFTPPTSPLTTSVSAGTVSLLTFQSNRFVDNSSNGFTLTPSGTPSVQAFSPFLPTVAYTPQTIGGSGYFDGTGDYLASATDAALVIGSGEFAIEWWEYRTTLRNVDTAIVLGNGTYGALLAYGDSNKPLFLLSTTGSSWNIFNSAPTLSTLAANQWTHFVVTRQSTGAGTSTFRVFVNGKLEIINTSGGSGTVYQPTNQIFVSGGVTGSSTPMQGYMSNVRVSIGAIPTAYQTSSTTVSATTVIFTPPTAPVTTTSQGATSGNVEYLLNFTNAGITDATAKNDLETVGNAQISTTQSKFGGSSMFFDGTGDWLTMRGSVDFAFGTGDFTMECWAYNTNSTQPQYLFMVDATGGISFGFESGSFVLGRRATAIDLSYTYTIPINSWVHYAVTRSGTTARLFINGVQVASNTNSLNYTVTGNTAVGGVPTTSVSFYGYIDDFRITKGFARYTANFVPPTSALQQQ
jgi:hypothetical protein